jgi:hypothetical protein
VEARMFEWISRIMSAGVDWFRETLRISDNDTDFKFW